jgi:hypothetical protein
MTTLSFQLPTRPNLIPKIRAMEEKIKGLEQDKFKAEQELLLLRQDHEKFIKIKWREEVRACLKNSAGYHILRTSYAISQCVAWRNAVSENRNLKLKIGTTLSMMFRDKEIGRVVLPNKRDFYYGDASLFRDDLKTIKKELKDKIEYQENIYQTIEK